MSAGARTWWGQRFMAALERFTDNARLQRGRAYGGDARVLAFDVDDGVVRAKVRGNVNPYFGVHREPRYDITIALAPLPKKLWAEAIGKIGMNAGLVARLMMGELPAQVEHVFADSEHRLLPSARRDFEQTRCSCPDMANPCKHIAGVYYRLARQLDADPLLLFELRGMPPDQLRTRLRATPLGAALAALSDAQESDVESAPSLFTRPTAAPTSPGYRNFWHGASALPVDSAPLQPAQVPAILVKKGGDYPAFWDRDASFIDVMERLYEQVRTKNKFQL